MVGSSNPSGEMGGDPDWREDEEPKVAQATVEPTMGPPPVTLLDQGTDADAISNSSDAVGASVPPAFDPNANPASEVPGAPTSPQDMQVQHQATDDDRTEEQRLRQKSEEYYANAIAAAQMLASDDARWDYNTKAAQKIGMGGSYAAADYIDRNPSTRMLYDMALQREARQRRAAAWNQQQTRDQDELGHTYEDVAARGVDPVTIRPHSKVVNDDFMRQEYEGSSVPRRLLNALGLGILSSAQASDFSRFRLLEERKRELLDLQAKGYGYNEDALRANQRSGRTPQDSLDEEIEKIEEAQVNLLKRVVESQKRMNEIPKNPRMERMEMAVDTADAFDVFWEDPAMILGEGFAEAAPMIAFALASTALLKTPGALLAGGIGFDEALKSEIVENLQSEGIDLTNPAAVRDAVNNRELMRKVVSGAWRYAVTTTAIDMAGGRAASKIRAATKGGAALSEGVGAAASESAGAYASGKDYEPGKTVKAVTDAAGKSIGDSAATGIKKVVSDGIDAHRSHAERQKQIDSNSYIDPETAKIEKAAESARNAINLAIAPAGDKSGFGANSASDPAQTVYIAPAKLREMIASRYFYDRRVKALGLEERIARAEAEGKDVEFPLGELNKDNVRGTRMRRLLLESKFEKDGPVAGDAIQSARTLHLQLRQIEGRYVKADKTVEGRYVFDRIRKELISEGMYPGDASQQAARRIQFYEKRAQSQSTPDRRETIDTIYLRDEYRRKQGIGANLVVEEGQRIEEDDYIRGRLRELDIAAPSPKR